MAVTMTKAELEAKYNSMTNVALCKELGVSKVTLISYLKKAGITLKGKGNNVKVLVIK